MWPRPSAYHARGSEYYLGAKEPDGVWYAPAGDLGRVDAAMVQGKEFARLYEGRGADGQALVSKADQRVPAFDLTFSVVPTVNPIRLSITGESVDNHRDGRSPPRRSADDIGAARSYRRGIAVTTSLTADTAGEPTDDESGDLQPQRLLAAPAAENEEIKATSLSAGRIGRALPHSSRRLATESPRPCKLPNAFRNTRKSE
jgi:hypothetical protein